MTVKKKFNKNQQETCKVMGNQHDAIFKGIHRMNKVKPLYTKGYMQLVEVGKSSLQNSLKVTKIDACLKSISFFLNIFSSVTSIFNQICNL